MRHWLSYIIIRPLNDFGDIWRSRRNRERQVTLHRHRHKDKERRKSHRCNHFFLIENKYYSGINKFIKKESKDHGTTWRKLMWSCVCESCSSSAFMNLIWPISISSCFMSPSVRLTTVFSRSLIICVISVHLLLMKRMSSVKILSLSSTAVCAERCRTNITISSYCCSHSLLCFSGTGNHPHWPTAEQS